MNKSIFVNKLNKIRQLNTKDKNFVNKDLYKLLCNKSALLAGYENIKSNKGATALGSYDLSLDGFSLLRLNNLRRELKNESWSPKAARRVYIAKPGNVEKRPLGIQGPNERVVQSVLSLILSAIYEPTYSQSSYGFCHSRGVHDALELISRNYDGMVYAIKGDIKSMFDTMDHHKLINTLKERINDDRFIRLIWKLLRTGYMDNDKLEKTMLGTAQGSIISPCLSNIYLDKFDKFMDKICVSAEKRSPNRRTPVFREIESQMRKVKRLLDDKGKSLDPEMRRTLIKSLMYLKKKTLTVRRYCNPSDRIVYTRYADDFIVGIAGSRLLTQSLRQRIEAYLETINLCLNPEKTKISYLPKEKTLFLGHHIAINSSVKIARVRTRNLRVFKRRVTGKFVVITAPIAHIISHLWQKGFCDKRGNPKHKVTWITQEDNQIISLFNASLRGVFGFYSGVQRKHSMTRIKYIFKFSCAMTLAAKHSSSLAKIFRKHGQDLRVNYGIRGEKCVSLCDFNLKKGNKIWQTGKTLPDPYRHIATRVARTKIYDKCCICGADSAEMHHVRHLEDSGERSAGSNFSKRIMGFIKRKQIPVCYSCHRAIHSGRYDVISLKQFKYPELAKK